MHVRPSWRMYIVYASYRPRAAVIGLHRSISANRFKTFRVSARHWQFWPAAIVTQSTGRSDKVRQNGNRNSMARHRFALCSISCLLLYSRKYQPTMTNFFNRSGRPFFVLLVVNFFITFFFSTSKSPDLAILKFCLSTSPHVESVRGGLQLEGLGCGFLRSFFLLSWKNWKDGKV